VERLADDRVFRSELQERLLRRMNGAPDDEVGCPGGPSDAGTSDQLSDGLMQQAARPVELPKDLLQLLVMYPG
jgi:hypothetical protein